MLDGVELHVPTDRKPKRYEGSPYENKDTLIDENVKDFVDKGCKN